MSSLRIPIRGPIAPFAWVGVLTASLPLAQLLLNAVGYSIPQEPNSGLDVLPVVVQSLNQDVTRVQFWGFVIVASLFFLFSLWRTPSVPDLGEIGRWMSIGMLVGAISLIYPMFRVEQDFLIGGSVAIICSAAFRRLSGRGFGTYWNRIVLVAVGLVIISVRFISPVFWSKPITGTINGYVNVSNHYFLTLMNGHDLVCCGGEFGLIDAPYGYLMPLVYSPLFLVFDLIDAPDRPVVVLLAGQLIVLGLAIKVLRNVAPRSWWIGLGVLLLIAPFLALSIPLGTPNLSSIRYLPIVIGLFAMSRHLVSAPDRLSRLRLLVVGAVLFALAPDTGFVALVGLAVFVTFATRNPVTRFALMGRTVMNFAISILIGVVLIVTASTLLLRSKDSNPGLDFISLFSGGFSALSVRWTPISSLILLLLAPLVIASVATYSQDRFRLDGAFLSSLSVMGVLWTTTFQNRMTNLNLWFLPLLIVVGYLRIYDNRSGLPLRQWASGRVPRLLLIFAVGGQSIVPLIHAAGSAIAVESAECVQVESVVDRRCVSREEASSVSAHLSFIQQIDEQRDWMVCSPLASEVLLLGFNDDSRIRMCKFRTRDGVEAARRYLMTSGPRFLAIPNKDDPVRLADPIFDWGVDELMRGLRVYREMDRVNGWVTYERQR